MMHEPLSVEEDIYHHLPFELSYPKQVFWLSQQWWFKMRSSGLWCHVVLWKDTSVSEVKWLHPEDGGSMDF